MISNQSLMENSSNNGNEKTAELVFESLTEKKRPFTIKYHSQKNISPLHFAPKPKPKKTSLTPSPMILCTKAKLENPFNLISLNEFDQRIESEGENESNENSINRENEYNDSDDGLGNESISALPLSNLKQKSYPDPFMRKESKDAEEILIKKNTLKSKANKMNEDEQEDIFDLNTLNIRKTISVLPNKSMIGYSILNYLEMACNDNSPIRRTVYQKEKHGFVNN